MTETQFIVTSKQNKRVLATQSHEDIFEFVKKNQDAKFRTIDYTAKTKIVSKQDYLKKYYKSQKNQGKLFVMIQILIKQDTAKSALVSEMKLNTEYKEFKANM